MVGSQLARAWPRTVVVVFRPDVGVRELDVSFVLDGEAVKNARFFRTSRDQEDFLHTVSLAPGEYEALITVYGVDGRGVEHRRVLTVPAPGLVRFDLRE